MSSISEKYDTIGFTTKPTGFQLVDIKFDIASPNTLKFGQKVTATITYNCPEPIQIWVMPDSRGRMQGTYEPSDVEPAGRHTLTRYASITSIDIGNNKLLGMNIVVKNDDSEVIYQRTINVDYTLVDSSDKKFNALKQDGVGTAELAYSRVCLHGTRLARHEVVPINVGIDAYMHIKCQDKHGLSFHAQPIELEGGWTPNSYEYPTPKEGKEVYSTFSVHEEGELQNFSFIVANKAAVTVAGARVDFPLTFIDMSGDGLGENEVAKNRISLVTDADSLNIYDEANNKLPSNGKIKVASTLKFDVDFSCVAQYGGRIEIYDLVGEGERKHLNELIYDSGWLKKDYFDNHTRETFTSMRFNEPRAITGFVLCLSNISGEVLDQQMLDYDLKVGNVKKQWWRFLLQPLVVQTLTVIAIIGISIIWMMIKKHKY